MKQLKDARIKPLLFSTRTISLKHPVLSSWELYSSTAMSEHVAQRSWSDNPAAHPEVSGKPRTDVDQTRRKLTISGWAGDFPETPTSEKLPEFSCGCRVDRPKPKRIMTAFFTHCYGIEYMPCYIILGHFKQNASFHFDDIDFLAPALKFLSHCEFKCVDLKFLG